MMRAGLLSLVVVVLVVSLARGATISGRVFGISDGDTLTVLTPAKQSVKVRLHGVDAPESKQAFGQRAKEELSSLVFGKEVRVDGVENDHYGRTVARVFVADLNVNVEMVRRGFAWWYRTFAKKDVALETAEAEARNAKRGLWSEANPTPPWDFRRNESKARKGVSVK